MNDSVVYHPFANISEIDQKNEDYKLYDALVAAVGDMNLTIPSSRKLSIDIFVGSVHDGMHEICIRQSNEKIMTYRVTFLPNSFRRFWTHMTLGFIEIGEVEAIKEIIEDEYAYESGAIVSNWKRYL